MQWPWRADTGFWILFLSYRDFSQFTGSIYNCLVQMMYSINSLFNHTPPFLGRAKSWVLYPLVGKVWIIQILSSGPLYRGGFCSRVPAHNGSTSHSKGDANTHTHTHSRQRRGEAEEGENGCLFSGETASVIIDLYQILQRKNKSTEFGIITQTVIWTEWLASHTILTALSTWIIKLWLGLKRHRLSGILFLRLPIGCQLT